MRMKFSALALSLIALPALGQSALRSTPSDSFKFISHEQLTQRLMTPEPNQVYSATFANDHEYYYVEFVKRLDHGNLVEQHAHWIDQIVVLSGQGVLTFGGTISQGRETSPGEIRGGMQSGARTQMLHPGDFVLIPAGMPHKFDAAAGAELTYVVYKERV